MSFSVVVPCGLWQVRTAILPASPRADPPADPPSGMWDDRWNCMAPHLVALAAQVVLDHIQSVSPRESNCSGLTILSSAFSVPA